MRKSTSFLAVLVVSAAITIAAYANDGMYTTSGNHLVPMHSVDIDVTQERLAIRRVDDVIEVSVHYELDNHGDEQTIIVGFEAKPPQGDIETFPADGEHPNMKDFTVSVNGELMDYDVALVPMMDYWTEDGLPLDQHAFYYQDGEIRSESEAEMRARIGDDYMDFDDLFVYHFDATFKPGRNVIDHRYRFNSSMVIGDLFYFDYVLRAINRWGNGQVEDFQLTIDMGELIEFQIPNTFFESASDWTVNGKGKIYATPDGADQCYFGDLAEESTTFAMYDGQVVFEKSNFTPTGDLYLRAPEMAFADGDFAAPGSDLSLNIYQDVFGPIIWEGSDLPAFDAYTQKVLRNYPFARRGYVFTDEKVQAYYDRQPWYIADPDYVPDTAVLSEQEQAIVTKLK